MNILQTIFVLSFMGTTVWAFYKDDQLKPLLGL